MTQANGVYCGSCGVPIVDERADLLPVERLKCPSCGSTTRRFDVSLTATVTARSMLGFKHQRPGYKEPIAEGKSGDDLHRKTGVWMRLTRLIDRLNDRYKERIVNHPLVRLSASATSH